MTIPYDQNNRDENFYETQASKKLDFVIARYRLPLLQRKLILRSEEFDLRPMIYETCA